MAGGPPAIFKCCSRHGCRYSYSSSSFTSAKALTANSKSSRECAAETCVRIGLPVHVAASPPAPFSTQRSRRARNDKHGERHHRVARRKSPPSSVGAGDKVAEISAGHSHIGFANLRMIR